jgi:hypothetical protein
MLFTTIKKTFEVLCAVRGATGEAGSGWTSTKFRERILSLQPATTIGEIFVPMVDFPFGAITASTADPVGGPGMVVGGLLTPLAEGAKELDGWAFALRGPGIICLDLACENYVLVLGRNKLSGSN